MNIVEREEDLDERYPEQICWEAMGWCSPEQIFKGVTHWLLNETPVVATYSGNLERLLSGSDVTVPGVLQVTFAQGRIDLKFFKVLLVPLVNFQRSVSSFAVLDKYATSNHSD